MRDPAEVLEIRDELLARWQLTPGERFHSPQNNWVTAVTREDGSSAVLKIGLEVGPTRSEIAALRVWNGHGTARLLASDEQHGAFLMELVEPGQKLAIVAQRDDDAATLVAVDVLRQLWRAAPPSHDLRTLRSWCGAYERTRSIILSGGSCLPVEHFQQADSMLADLLASTAEDVVLHGDLHHFNILSSSRAWLAIDPKGLLGDRTFDVCQFLRNPFEVPVQVNRRRLDIFCAQLGLDRERTRAWCFVHAVLNALWDLEEGQPIARDLAYVEQTLSF